MAKNISLMGASYPDVPAVVLPQTGGGIASFTDISDTTAVAADVANGKVFYTADGTKETGTASASGLPEKAVNFYDYDGELLHSYTAAEAQALENLPANPAHEGLTAQGWNWTLAEIKSTLTTYPHGTIDVGQMYTTDDGNTRLYIHIESDQLDIVFKYWQNHGEDVSVCFGDSDTFTALTGYGYKTMTHTYAEPGDYVVEIKPTNSGSLFRLRGGNSESMFMNAVSMGIDQQILRKAEIGPCITTLEYAFRQSYNLESVSIPNTVTTVGYSFTSCLSLKHITFPTSVTTIGAYALNNCMGLLTVSVPLSATGLGSQVFSYCTSLKRVGVFGVTSHTGTENFRYCFALRSIGFGNGATSIGANYVGMAYNLDRIDLPASLTSLGNSAFANAYRIRELVLPNGLQTIGQSAFAAAQSLAKLTIPATVTSIATKAFQSCTSLHEVHMLGTTPPSLGASDVFTGYPSDMKIYVPAESVSTYTAASDWSSFAAMIEAEPS